MGLPMVASERQAPAQCRNEEAYAHFEALGEPRWICAPMVDGSELAFRMLTRKYGVQLAYTPMLHSALMLRTKTYKGVHFTTCPEDRPLAAQFCGNEPQTLLKAARMVEDDVDAVDINFGCPQGIAKRGRYGAFLQDDWNTIKSLVESLRDNLKVPVWCKIRVFPDVQRTVEYAKMIEQAGCQLLAVHGRTREQKGTQICAADWNKIRAVKRALSIPVIANGNVAVYEDAERALRETECDGVMSAWGLLTNPALFAGNASAVPSRMELAKEYTELAEKYNTQMSMVRLHLFKLMRTRLDANMDLNQSLAKCRNLADFRLLLQTIESRCDFDGITFEQRMAAKATAAALTIFSKRAAIGVLPERIS